MKNNMNGSGRIYVRLSVKSWKKGEYIRKQD